MLLQRFPFAQYSFFRKTTKYERRGHRLGRNKLDAGSGLSFQATVGELCLYLLQILQHSTTNEQFSNVSHLADPPDVCKHGIFVQLASKIITVPLILIPDAQS